MLNVIPRFPRGTGLLPKEFWRELYFSYFSFYPLYHCSSPSSPSKKTKDDAEALEKMGVKPEEIALKMIPKTTHTVEKKSVANLLKLIDALEENEDVQNVFSNADISDEDMEEAMAD